MRRGVLGVRVEGAAIRIKPRVSSEWLELSMTTLTLYAV